MYIGRAARLSGTTIKTIRHYEAIGLLPPPQRQGKYRVYTQQSVELLTFIKCAQQLGFKLKEMQSILEGHPGFDVPLASKAIADKKLHVTEQINRLRHLYEGLEAFETSFEGASYTTCGAQPVLHESCDLALPIIPPSKQPIST